MRSHRTPKRTLFQKNYIVVRKLHKLPHIDNIIFVLLPSVLEHIRRCIMRDASLILMEITF